jgi:hypothetical protein
MRKLLADALYAAANTLCIAAQALWADDDYWNSELEEMYAWADDWANAEDTGDD